nr:MAG TPA: Head fiber protein [Crassvirales sp.]
MRRFRDIIESPFPVPTNVLWLKGSTLKGFINGKWTTLGGADKVAWNDITDKPEFATVSISGSYNDLKDKPTIPPAYSLPIANRTALGGVKSSTTGTTPDRDYLVEVNSDGAMKVNVPWIDTTYPVVSENANGLMSVALLQKLNGIEAQANKYTLPAAGASLGGVKIASAVADTDATEAATAQTVATTLNELLAALRASGVLTA